MGGRTVVLSDLLALLAVPPRMGDGAGGRTGGSTMALW